MKKTITITIIFIAFLVMGCQKTVLIDDFAIMETPAHFPELVFPLDNEYTYERWSLGKELFYSNALSRDNTISCGTCHKPELSFTDELSKSEGIDMRLGERNAPSLANIGYHPYFTREGEVPTLEMQILVPIQEHSEFDFNIVLIADRLQQNSTIVSMTEEAYDRAVDAFTITRSISTFERSLISGNSTYDKYITDKYQFSKDEKAGQALFFSDRLGCMNCHGDFNFTDYSITNNGLYRDYDDQGRYRVTYDSIDLATFKVPSLRNVDMTAPYMHDGSISTLEEVIEHYDNGIQDHINLDDRIQNFDLSSDEKQQLLSFLKTLSDHDFINNSNFKQ